MLKGAKYCIPLLDLLLVKTLEWFSANSMCLMRKGFLSLVCVRCLC